MMKAWKGRTGIAVAGVYMDKGSDKLKGGIPVLVIDASGFPKDYPMIGSEWLHNNTVTVVSSNPFQDGVGTWVVVAHHANGCRLMPNVCDLKPIPKQATGEVVGTLTKSGMEHSAEWGCIPDGTYDIIKRGAG